MNESTYRKPASRSDVAKAASVSEATVSLALNAHPRVAERTRIRVVEAAERLGYIPNRAARRMIQARFPAAQRRGIQHVGLLLIGQENTELGSATLTLLCGAEREAADAGASLLFARIDSPADNARRNMLQNEDVDGWLATGHIDDSVIKMLKSWQRPFAILGDNYAIEPAHTVNVDFTAASRMAVQHLVNLGHRRIAFLGGAMHFAYQHELASGFRATTEALGCDQDDELFQVSTELEKSRPGEQHCIALINSIATLKPRPTALVIGEPGIAARLQNTFQTLNLEFPRDMSLVTIESERDESRLLGATSITSISAEVGHTGIRLLRDLVATPELPPHIIRVAPTLHKGTSCSQLAVN